MSLFLTRRLRASLYPFTRHFVLFAGFDWVRLLQKEIQAPWIPKLKSKKDTAFFEPPDEPEDNRPYEDDGTGWDKDF